MSFIVDASVTAAWLLPDESSPVAEEARHLLMSDTAVAPVIWWLEIRNLLVVAERRSRIRGDDITPLLVILADLPIAIDNAPAENHLIEIARKHRLSIYDASYLELALRSSLPLATLDAGLAAAARNEAVDIIRS